MATNTTNNYFSKPAVGGDTDTWGTTLNANWDAVDSIVTGGTQITRLGIGTTNSTLPLICNAASATDIAASFSGLVGIGTTSPDQRLQVDGNIRLGDTAVGVDDDEDYNITTGGQLTIHANDSGGNQNYVSLNLSCGNPNGSEAASSRISCIVNDDEKMRIDASGNVGIGTDSPDQKGHISGAGTQYLRVENTTNGVVTDFGTTSTGSTIINRSAHPMSFSTNSTERMHISSTGVVDINNYLRIDRIDCKTGQQLVLNAGESATVASGQSGEKVYVNAEEGLEVNTTPPSNNWASGWAGRKTAVLRGDNLSVQGGATFDGGTSTTVNVLCDNAGNASLNLMGGDQGTGRLFVGQGSDYGGGIEYNGDSVPVTSGGGSDQVTLFRRTNNINVWTARNSHSNNDWEFRGKVKADSLEGTLVQSIFNQIYPVGAVYISTSTASPATLFGGTWTAIGGGRVLQTVNGTTPSAGSNYSDNSRGISVSNMPEHAHVQGVPYSSNLSSSSGYSARFGAEMNTGGTRKSSQYGASSLTNDYPYTSSVGSGTAFNVQQASYGVYMWKRATLAT